MKKQQVFSLFEQVAVKKIDGKYAVYKPMLLLYALSKVFHGENRLTLFSEINQELSVYVKKYSINSNFHYPFYRLQGDKVWEIEANFYLKVNDSGDVSKKDLVDAHAKGGFTEDIYQVLSDDKCFLLLVVEKVINTYLSDEVYSEFLFALDFSNNKVEEVSLKSLYNSTNELTNEDESKAMVKHNGYISYLNSLHNLNASGANALAESQALSHYFTEIYEPFSLVESLYQALTDSKERVILLTGHAGDGKSTVALDVLKRLKGWPLDQPIETALGEKEDITGSDGQQTYIVKDMSELTAEQRINWLTQGIKESGNWLIVSNTGPLINSFLQFSEQEGLSRGIESQILTVLDKALEDGDFSKHTLSLFSKEVVIINMTRLDNVDLAARILNRMVNHSAWADCSECHVKSICSLRSNHLALLAMGTDLDERIRWIYKRISAYEQRLTLRQMVAHLALSITGGIDCSTEQANHINKNQLDNELGRSLSGNVFSESFFGYREGGNWSAAENLLAVRLIRRSVFGGPIAVNFERQLMMNGQWAGVTIPENLKDLQLYWKKRSQDPEGVRWRFALRRMLYVFTKDLSVVEGSDTDQFLDGFIKSPMLRQFDFWQIQMDLVLRGDKKRQLLKSCLQTLLEVYSGFCSGQFQEGELDWLYLTLRRADQSVIQPTQLVIAKLSNGDFRLSYDSSKRLPVLLYRNSEGEAKLSLTLPLLDYIHDRAIGNLGNELAPIHLSQLEWFKAELLKLNENKHFVDEVGLLRSGIDGEVKLHRYVVNENELEIY